MRIEKQFTVGSCTILCFGSEEPKQFGDTITIDGTIYKTEIVYDLPNAIGIHGTGYFVGKEAN